jgi:hypothetical protein
MRSTLLNLTFGLALALVVLFVALGCSGHGPSGGVGANSEAIKGAADGGHGHKGKVDAATDDDDDDDGGDENDDGDDHDDKDEGDD